MEVRIVKVPGSFGKKVVLFFGLFISLSLQPSADTKPVHPPIHGGYCLLLLVFISRHRRLPSAIWIVSTKSSREAAMPSVL